jgi:endonuclease/exonuclease/phosphatase family metal-dependent hydrolase
MQAESKKRKPFRFRMKPLPFIHRIMMILNMITTLLFIVAAYSYLISPNQSVFFSYLGLLFPFFLFLNLIHLFYWLFFRKWMRLFISICSFLICWKPIMSYAPVNLFHPAAPSMHTVSILSYNVMGFGYQDHTADNPNPIIRYITDADADIVCLQEYMTGASSNKVLTEDKIRRALNMYPYYYHLPLVDYNRYTIGLGIFSKYPIKKSWKVRYDSAFNGSTVHELDVDGKTVYIINNHLESFKLTMGDRSRYTEFITNVNTGTFDNLLETVQHKLGLAFHIRAEQAEIVADEIRSLRENRVIVCGDFNDTPISYAYRTVRGALDDAFEDSGNGIGVTYNQNFFWFRIDHFLHSPAIKAYGATVDKVPFSDHYPIRCTFEIP